ncbi:hypothetical protein [Clostridium sp. HBUAS56010]|uniref:hypothetical protein n=1 Tax=Clostridium sp. HBUAS56010 TaxID=2571127 RepID=UPI00163D9E00|nr:hypothetical protein [Clostridium sp. HBUAS56010]
MKLYATLKNSDKVFVLSQDTEKDARQAELTVDEYVEAVKRINPQFGEVWTV